MSRTKNVLTFMVGLVLGVFAVLGMSGVEATEYRFDTGDNRNLVTVVNQHATLIDELRSKLVGLAAHLDADGTAGADYEDIVANSPAAITSTNVAHTARAR